MSHEGDEMQVNGAEGADLSQSVVVVQPSSVAEPEDRLVAQSPPPPMPLSMARPPGSRVVQPLFCRCSICTGMNMLRVWWIRRPVLWWSV